MMQKKEKKISETKKNDMNKSIVTVTCIFLGLFLILGIYFSYLFGWSGKKLILNPYNKLFSLLSEKVTRGDIYSADGELLATTGMDENGEEYRLYPFHETYCHVVGGVENGMTGLEAAYHYDLLTSDESILTKIAHDFSDEKNRGNNIITTLDSRVQTAAVDALGGYEGAVIVMNSKTGEVLAMVSSPVYDPNSLQEDWEEIQESDSSVLLNRATQGLYTPGSIFKTITLYEYLKEYGEGDYHFDCDGSIHVAGEVIRCNGSKAHGEETLKDSFAYSCNSSFVNIGQMLSPDSYRATCERLLFGKELPVEIDSKKSSFSLQESDGDFLKAQTYFGQGETLMTPMHVAILTQSLANEGVAMKPVFVKSVTNYSGETVRQISQKKYKELFTREEALQMKEYLRAVVEYGTAKQLNSLEHMTVYGKTGSGEIDSKGNYNSWFMGFAEKEDGENYTVVVVAEGIAQGTAGPSVSIALEILKVLD